MSIRLNDGYRLTKCNSLPRLFEFQKDFRKFYREEILYPGFRELFRELFKEYYTKLIYLDSCLDSDPKAYETIKEELRRFARITSKVNWTNVHDYVDGRRIEIGYCFDSDLADYYSKDMTTNDWCYTICREIDIKSEVLYKSPYATDNRFFTEGSLSFFMSDNDVIFLAFNGADKAVRQILSKQDPIVKKYGLEPFGYWENADPPVGVSYKDFVARKLEWENAIPTGFPYEHDLVIRVGGQRQIQRYGWRMIEWRWEPVIKEFNGEDFRDEVADYIYRERELLRLVPPEQKEYLDHGEYLAKIAEAIGTIKATYDKSEVERIKQEFNLPLVDVDLLQSNVIKTVPNFWARFIQEVKDNG